MPDMENPQLLARPRVPKTDLLPGSINFVDTPPASALQVSKLRQRYGLPASVAAVIAEHLFGSGRARA